MSERWTPQDLAEYQSRMAGDPLVQSAAKWGAQLVQSELESEMAVQIKLLKLPKPEREFAFAKPRRWRFDFAWPSKKVALETEGGEWSGGRHTRGEGFTNDCIKYSEAAIRGWKVIRVTGKMIKEGLAIELLKRALKNVGETTDATSTGVPELVSSATD